MITGIIFLSRLALVLAVGICVWRFIEPKTQTRRILRAALLVLVYLLILAATGITGQ